MPRESCGPQGPCRVGLRVQMRGMVGMSAVPPPQLASYQRCSNKESMAHAPDRVESIGNNRPPMGSLSLADMRMSCIRLSTFCASPRSALNTPSPCACGVPASAGG